MSTLTQIKVLTCPHPLGGCPSIWTTANLNPFIGSFLFLCQKNHVGEIAFSYFLLLRLWYIFRAQSELPSDWPCPGSHGPTLSVFIGKGSHCSSAHAGSPSLQLHLFKFTFLKARTEHRWDPRYPEQWCKHCPCSLGKYELLNTLEIAFPLSCAGCTVICSCLSTNRTFSWF